MSQLSRFLAQGFAATSKICGTVPMTAGPVTKQCQLDNAQATKTLMASGLWAKCTHTAELTREAFAALGIVDRKVLTVAGTKYTVILIEGKEDVTDPCIRVHLRLAHLPA